ncbi:hypothetical protein FGADI_6873 [Fusarium gaditjirri]|uniref:Uncharacterized protein n=1 Tax=Fusarium gaditjirri TaxID=282569 RepID=A0A8H4T6Q6_9HYPO|nr:hypothetical protein FGADI_6873 [Fusarium gaditjirri]
MFKPLKSDPPLIDKDDPERLSPATLRLADNKPVEFVHAFAVRQIMCVRSKRVLTPVSAGTDATSPEPLSMRCFYQLVLFIPNFPETWTAIIDELRSLQRSTGQASIQQVTELYRALNEHQLSGPERITIQKLFLQHSLITVEQGSVIVWQTHLTCIWSPLNKIRNLAELSRPYPYLKDFFVGLLKVEEATEKTVLSRMSYWTPEFEIRDLFSLLNDLIVTSKISMKPDELLLQRIFLGKRNDEKYRFVGSTEEFFIPDDEEFATTFKDNLPLLDVTAEEIALLDPLFTWLGFKARYLSKHVYSRCTSPPTAQKQKIKWDIAQRAEGILRGTLLNILKKGEMLAVQGMQSEKVVLTRQKGSRCLGTGPNHNHGLTAPSTHPKLAITVDEAGNALDRLVVYVSSDEEERDLALFTVLPQRLMAWLMADPKTRMLGTVTVLGVSLLKSVLTAPPNVIDAILTREGVGRVRVIEVNLTTMRQEVAPQNTTSNGPVDQPSQSSSQKQIRRRTTIQDPHKDVGESACKAAGDPGQIRRTTGISGGPQQCKDITRDDTPSRPGSVNLKETHRISVQ